MRLAWSVIVVCSMLAVGCSRQPAITMPDAAPGWNRTGQVRTFAAKKLYEYMDGEAEKYIQAGVKQTITANYRHQSGLEATADVFVMPAGLGPIQLLGAEPGTDSRGVGLGEAARVYASSLAFRRGRYLVRVVAFGEGPRVSVQLEDLAKTIDQQLK